MNKVELKGYLVNNPQKTVTKVKNFENSLFLLAVKREDQKTPTYIPCLAKEKEAKILKEKGAKRGRDVYIQGFLVTKKKGNVYSTSVVCSDVTVLDTVTDLSKRGEI